MSTGKNVLQTTVFGETNKISLVDTDHHESLSLLKDASRSGLTMCVAECLIIGWVVAG